MTDHELTKHAVIYLRVSSDAQVETDLDRDGLSLSAQRGACARKAAGLDARVVDEFVERCETATTTSNRPALKRMLQRLKARDVDFVIVHKVDRLARKRADDSTILAAIQASGAKLVSVSENIDETPSGMLLHGIMASIAEFYSMNLAQEVLKGTTEKAKRGGTPFRAPIGYLNTRQVVEGREIRVVTIDPERGPLIREAFRLYASGDFPLSDLAALLEARGLKSRPTPKVTARVLNANRLSDLLRNDFYTGLVRYAGKVYPGRHEPLVPEQTFEQVQTVLAGQRQSGEKSWRHHHYLRGSIFCAECSGRLFYTRTHGNGGLYEYFTCRGRQRGICTQPHHRIEAVESGIEQHYASLQLTVGRREQIARAVREFCEIRQSASAPDLAAATKKLEQIRRQERKLLDAHYQDQISEELFAHEQARIRRERVGAETTITNLQVDDRHLLARLDTALNLTDRIQTAYIRGTPQQRRLFNQAFFARLKIDDGDVANATLTEPFGDLLHPDLAAIDEQPPPKLTSKDLTAILDPDGTWTETPVRAKPRHDPALAAAGAPAGPERKPPTPSRVGGWYLRMMVANPGLEPGTPRFSVVCSTN